MNEIQRLQTHSTCKHEINLVLLSKTGQLYCGHCRKAIFLPSIGQWLPLDREYPKEWES
jgi:hypothetical protein